MRVVGKAVRSSIAEMIDRDPLTIWRFNHVDLITIVDRSQGKESNVKMYDGISVGASSFEVT